MEDVFRQRLHELRARKGISQLTLGQLCGLSKNVICLYESGDRYPSAYSLISLADFFDVSTDYLLGLTDSAQRC